MDDVKDCISFCLLPILLDQECEDMYVYMRTPYKDSRHTFSKETLSYKEPIGLFREWFELASKIPSIREPNAMVLATANKEGRPSARFVLLKGFGKDGFKFYSNYESRKGKEITENPHAALTFYWEPLHRQIRVEGSVTRLSKEESDEYFNSRPRESQISCSVSKQSSVIPNREYLSEERKKFEDMETIPRPKNWGGFIVKPEVIEFWQGQTNRAHDRIRFSRQEGKTCCPKLSKIGDDGWVYERLAP
ncbi:pyridoxine-5'-phosphate oxidase-like isoform X2 [Centruroides sculpturatus]|uniref:pyridoxine-5'-phosphate oxidase-like isoform X2 n=1 Tax=Centruroides sculpturatus TaxID=218467 RepID=UPI000C6D1650|nr:pyridoxine-5'-phosphate oxidase-like isoform X2 [Centruroides sculpturatus]